MSKFSIQGISCNGSMYGGVRGQQLDHGNQIDSEGSDGQVNEAMHSILRAAKTADITTLAARAWTNILTGSLDLPMLALDGVNGLKMYGALAASNAPGFDAGSNHQVRTGLRGLIYASGYRWSFPGYLELSLRAMFTSAVGTTDPITPSTAALPTQLLSTEKLTLESLTAGAQSLTSVRSVDVQIDPKFDFDYSTGLPFPVDITGAGARGHLAVKMEIDTDELALGAGTGACSAVFRAASGNGATIGTTGLQLTLNGAWSVEESEGGSQGSPKNRRLVVRTTKVGATRPLTWSILS
jgi:hypothetical protein